MKGSHASPTLGPRIGMIDTAPLGSIPDGATVDRDGNIWVVDQRDINEPIAHVVGTFMRMGKQAGGRGGEGAA